MKYWILFILATLSFNCKLVAHEPTCKWNPSFILHQCSESILRLEHGKAYLRPEKLFIDQDKFFLQTDESQWISLKNISWDESGYYVDMWEPLCPNGHVGIYRVKKIWYCMEESCPYFIGENFVR